MQQQQTWGLLSASSKCVSGGKMGPLTGVSERYIRIVGTHNTVNKIFHIVAFECMFTNKTFTLEKGLIDPQTHNPLCLCLMLGLELCRTMACTSPSSRRFPGTA
ncbi:hypothetical protein STEG23_037189 [Scotinomys teguina]